MSSGYHFGQQRLRTFSSLHKFLLDGADTKDKVKFRPKIMSGNGGEKKTSIE